MNKQKVKTVVHKNGVLHIETPLGVINITVGLNDCVGRRVESIAVSGNNYAGEPKVVRRGEGNVRLLELKTVKGGR